MSSTQNVQIVDKLFSKACQDLKEGRFTKDICFLFFVDGYSPLLIDAPASHYLQLAGGVISTLDPELYVYIFLSYEPSISTGQAISHITAVAVNRDGTNWSLRRPYKHGDGEIIFTSEVVHPTSLDMNITGPVTQLYMPPNVSSETMTKIKYIVDKVSPYLKVSKIPYSKVTVDKGH